MEARSDVRGRMVPVAALAAGVMVATATVVSPVAVPHAEAPAHSAVVREVKSLPVQLSAYNPVYPFAQPVGPLGYAIAIPLATAVAALQPAVQQVTDLLTTLQLDPRLAQQPVLLTRSLVIPVAVGLQTALTGALEGTYVYGRFTPIEAVNFFIESVKTAIDQTIAAQRELFGLPGAGPAPQVESPELPEESDTVMLSTEPQQDAERTQVAELTESRTVETPSSPSSTADDAETREGNETVEDVETLDSAVGEESDVEKESEQEPTWKRPAFKLPTVKLSTPKIGTGRTNSAADDDAPAPSGDDSDTGSDDDDATGSPGAPE